MSSAEPHGAEGYARVPNPVSDLETSGSGQAGKSISSCEWYFGSRAKTASSAVSKPARSRRLSRRQREARRRLLVFSSDEEDGVSDKTLLAKNSRRSRESNFVPPSQSVPEPEIGSASDAGVLPQNREVHRNRRRAAVLLLETLDVDGRRIGTCDDFHKFFSPTSLYTNNLVVPKAERDIKICRAPPNHLSYELQERRCVRPGDDRRPQRIGGRGRSGRRPASKKLRVDPAGVSAELSPASSPHGSGNSETEGSFTPAKPLKTIEDQSAKSNLQEFNSASQGSSRSKPTWFLPEHKYPASPDPFFESDDPLAKGRLPGSKSPWSHPLIVPRRVDELDDPANASEEDLLTALFAQAKKDPDASLRGCLSTAGKQKRPQRRRPSTMVNDSKFQPLALENNDAMNGELSGEAEVVVVETEAETETLKVENLRPREDLSKFEKNLLLSLQFSDATKRIAVDDEGRHSVIPAWTTLPVQETAEKGFGVFELHTKRFGSKYLKKFGFTGRLGAAGQGISNPLEGRPAAGRSGLGTRPNADAYFDNDPLRGVKLDSQLDFDVAMEKFKAKEETHVASVCATADSRKRKRTSDKDRGYLRETNADVFSSRRQDAMGPSLLQEDVGHWSVSRRGDAADHDLKHEDDVESCDEDEDGNFDTGRRGILVDFDALVKGAYRRRLEAFEAGVAGFDGIAHGFDVTPALFVDGRDVGDENAVRNILVSNNLEVTDEMCDALLSRIDGAFDEMDAPERDEALLGALKAASQKCHVGILHRGSKRRLNAELKATNLATAFNTRKMVLHHSDVCPYTKSWKELMCRVGVTARQSILVVNDVNMNPVPSFVIAGRILGARTMVSVERLEEQAARHARLEDHFDADCVAVDGVFNNGSLSFSKLLKYQAPPPRRRRVLALYSTEGLWYAGRVEYECGLPDRAEDKILVRYYKWDNLEWVDPVDAVPLPKCNYETMQKHGFCGLLEADVSVL
jgi:hypothetical protein